MKTITIASRKGGGGKSTVARHLAVEAAAQGCGPVCIVDSDPMGTNSSGIDAAAPGPGPACPVIPDKISGRPTAEAADAGTAAGTILRQR